MAEIEASVESAPADAHRVGRRRARRRVRTALSEKWLLRFLQSVVATAVLGSVLAIGAVHLPVLAVLAVVSLLGALTAIRLSGVPRPVPAFIALALAAYTLLQAVPVPSAILRVVSPASEDVWSRALLPFGESGPRWASVSLDPGASLREALKWFTYALSFVAAHAIAAKRGSAWGVALVFGASVAAALTTLAHGLLGVRQVFGIYQPRFEPAAWHVGPLLNPNNLSGYLGMGSLCGVGLLLGHKPSIPKWLLAFGIALTVAVDVTAASRGGILALSAGLILLAALQMVRRRRNDVQRSASGVSGKGSVIVALVGGTMLAYFGATAETWKELASKNFEKLSLIRASADLIRAHPWWGVGRGAFESVFPAYGNTPKNVVFTHAECFPVDWVAGWGLPVGGLALLAFAWSLRPSRLGALRSAAAASGYAGFAALLIQNLVDLGLEVPAVSVAASVLVGSLAGGAVPRSSRGAHEQAPSRRYPWLAGTTLAVAGLLLFAALRWGWNDITSEREELHERLGSLGPDATSRDLLRRDLRAAMLRHPADPYLPLVGAMLAWKARDQNPLPWLARTLERDVTNGRAHLLLSEVLHAHGRRGQALLELRLAVEGDADLARPAAMRALRWTSECDELERAVPEGVRGAPMLSALAAQMSEQKLEPCKLRFLRSAIERAPEVPGPHAMLAFVLIEHLGAGPADPTCGHAARAGCEAEVEVHADAVARALPETSDALRIRARLRRQLGDRDQAEKMLAEGCFAATDRADCLLLRAQIAAEMPSPDRLLPAVRDYLAVSCASAADCATANDAVGNLFAARGDWGMATSSYARAAREAPTEDRWLAVANASSRSGAHAQAMAALEKVARLRGGADDALRARIESEREKAMGQLNR